MSTWSYEFPIEHREREASVRKSPQASHLNNHFSVDRSSSVPSLLYLLSPLSGSPIPGTPAISLSTLTSCTITQASATRLGGSSITRRYSMKPLTRPIPPSSGYLPKVLIKSRLNCVPQFVRCWFLDLRCLLGNLHFHSHPHRHISPSRDCLWFQEPGQS